MEQLVERAAELLKQPLEEVTGLPWQFHSESAIRLSDDRPRRPSAFLEESALRMVEGPFDATIVLTDVALVSRNNQMVPGLASSTARIIVVSASRLQSSPRGEPKYSLEDESVQLNTAALLLHLLGHLLGLRHQADGSDSVMSPFSFRHSRKELPGFSDPERSRLRKAAEKFPEREDLDRGTWSELKFHVRSALRHPKEVLTPLVRSRAPFLPLRLPRLTTTALVPTFILVFTAEIWDAGFHMTNTGVWTFTVLSVLASSLYVLLAQNLFLPRKERRYHTEHLAVANVSIMLTVLVAMAGLFIILWLLMLGIQLYIFPPDLIREWPSLEIVRFSLLDQIRIAALISTIGVLTGALGGGLENRELIRNLALFETEP